MSFNVAFKRVFKNLYSGKGRAGRIEYSIFFVFFIGISFLSHSLMDTSSSFIGLLIFLFLGFFPFICALVRRFNDTGGIPLSTKVVFYVCPPIILFIGFLMCFTSGDPEENEYGLPPDYND